jgi:septal ring factor EnvC (AmiA/AmiB activator)
MPALLTNLSLNSSLLRETYSVVLAELEKNHNELRTTMSTLQKMSLAVPEQLSQQSEQLSEMVSIMTEISTTSAEISKISTGVHELQRKCKGNYPSSSGLLYILTDLRRRRIR